MADIGGMRRFRSRGQEASPNRKTWPVYVVSMRWTSTENRATLICR